MTADAQAQATAPYPTGTRILAAVIDVILLGIVFVVLSIATGGAESDTSGDGASLSANLGTGPTLLYVVIVFGYYALMEGLTGATIGKMLTGMRVVKLDGTPMDLGAAALRTLGRIIDGLPFLYLVGLLMIVIRSDHRRVGDLLGSTIVVKAG